MSQTSIQTAKIIQFPLGGRRAKMEDAMRAPRATAYCDAADSAAWYHREAMAEKESSR